MGNRIVYDTWPPLFLKRKQDKLLIGRGLAKPFDTYIAKTQRMCRNVISGLRSNSR
ncbi:hypothetical protein TBK1r_01770 [Stieleria magnilauensis]|uniref:Uncharacterized protein n=1 Tax=Stieleria magnilauensis TaxID=2527963 RepID=A0ABX5XGZ5_9BACT|nr:hypothetical protein TBK1r_01770 [Planctomycetes bacterium TBK1r]